ncbi:hypothetical protein O6H91_17G052300 [Diphasiastrum complanatum]|uniref:Uncharacterized protein n=1 Tax=Diphasiastrum complanatum TaxID=34168 RepID=A0ACC2B6U9_DIPCM|nr:hypothetical protein O6H91_17G052300 [Diphasiastrum complanatum]
MVNLKIRLSKGVGAEATAPKGVEGADLVLPSVASGPPACLDHLVLDDLPFGKGVGLPTANATVNILGRKSQRKLGHKVHFCVRCNFPIAIYGRLDPCEHVFCLTCAKKDPICFLCEEKIACIQKLEVLEGIYICGAPGCLRSFLRRLEFETHVKDIHKGLLEKRGQKIEQVQEDTVKVEPQSQVSVAIQGQLRFSSPPRPLQPQQPKQPQLDASEDKPVRVQVKQSPTVSNSSQREEKQLRPHQSKAASLQHDRHAHQKQQQQQQQQHAQHLEQHQYAHQSQKKPMHESPENHQHNNRQQSDHHPQHAHQQIQHHGPHDKQHRPPHSEKQQQQHSDKLYQQRPLHRPPQNQQGLPPPPFPAQAFASPYHMQQEGRLLQQPHTPRYDSPRFGPFVDQRMPMHAGIMDYQEKPRPRHSGHVGMHQEDGHQEGFASLERQPPIPHYHGEYGPRGPPQVMGIGMDRPPHFQEMPHSHLPPASKRGKYGPSSPIGEGSADPHTHGWSNVASKFGPGPGFMG